MSRTVRSCFDASLFSLLVNHIGIAPGRARDALRFVVCPTGSLPKCSVGARVFFLFVCGSVRVRVSVVWSPVGMGSRVQCHSASVLVISVLPRRMRIVSLWCRQGLLADSVRLSLFSFCSEKRERVLVALFQLARDPHRLESPWGCRCLGLSRLQRLSVRLLVVCAFAREAGSW